MECERSLIGHMVVVVVVVMMVVPMVIDKKVGVLDDK